MFLDLTHTLKGVGITRVPGCAPNRHVLLENQLSIGEQVDTRFPYLGPVDRKLGFQYMPQAFTLVDNEIVRIVSIAELIFFTTHVIHASGDDGPRIYGGDFLFFFTTPAIRIVPFRTVGGRCGRASWSPKCVGVVYVSVFREHHARVRRF